MIPLWSQIITLVLASALLSLIVAVILMAAMKWVEHQKVPFSDGFIAALVGACLDALVPGAIGCAEECRWRDCVWPHIANHSPARVPSAVRGNSLAISGPVWTRLCCLARPWCNRARDHGFCRCYGPVTASRLMRRASDMPNQRPGVDAGWALLFAFGHDRPRATQAGR